MTHLKEDGTVDNVTIQSDSFEEAAKEYISALDPNITKISKKKVFDDLKFPILEQILGLPILEQILGQRKLKTDLELGPGLDITGTQLVLDPSTA